MEWRPIETAPRDGTWILVTRGDGHEIMSAHWKTVPANWSNIRYGWGNGAVFWDDEKGFRASYWMPLPPPPAVAECA